MCAASNAHALQSVPVPSPHLASSVSGSSTCGSISHSETVACHKQLAGHSFTQQTHFQYAHVAPEVTRRLQGLQTLGHLWRSTAAGPSSSFSSENTDCPPKWNLHTMHVVPESVEAFSTSSGEHNSVHLDMLLLQERERRVTAEQCSQATDQAAMADKEALVEVRKENAVLHRACGYGKVP